MDEHRKKNGMPWQPMEFVACIGFDAFRIATGQKPRHFTVAEVVRWLQLVAERQD